MKLHTGILRSAPAGAAMVLTVVSVVLTSGCATPQQTRAEYRAGDTVPAPPLTYTVVEAQWKSQLDSFPTPRVPDRNFLLVHILVTNGGGSEVSIPTLRLENSKGEEFVESDNGTGIDGWLGMLRRLSPAQSADGWILFDVPTNSYQLRVSNGSLEAEKAAYITIPLTIPDKQ